jgi:nucleotide-binding universal stress UspA family protein
MTTIAYASGLRAEEEPCFVHAAALAASAGARLVVVHASDGTVSAEELPSAAQYAERWGVAIRDERVVHTCCDDVTDTLLDALRRIEPDLVIASSYRRHGVLGLLSGSVAEAVARNVKVPTLIVPIGARGFVDATTGAIDLRRVIVGAGDDAAVRAGLDAADRLAELAGVADVETVLVHVDDGSPEPVTPAGHGRLAVTRTHVGGRVDAALERAARDFDACALVMATRGHDGIADALFGSHTEHVLRSAHCPFLVVPLAA